MHWLTRAVIAVVLALGYGYAFKAITTLRTLYWPNAVPDTIYSLLPPLVVAFVIYGLLTLVGSRKPRDTETRCRKCGYILQGISEPRCPECGERI